MKDVRRQDAKERKEAAPPPIGGVDPDLEGMVAGPQPLNDWQVEGLAAFEEADAEEEEGASETG
ncbi:MAG: hypothetical protein P8J30_10245 [Ilumatobacter sp.]|jgi:hypothetical protein|nr:hypothetical protein [Ilumatobacter sp.]